ncbi:sucrose operon repressor ScrR [Photobacterium angustum]|uniref:LacI family DNA-binding transcriptional regulator n=1 Tax=Photobacterium angustum TaxID=661 RepID=UPI0005E7AFB0|nr:LacI family DNA-binding transcriptional regulator [Photobacterium angustum]KJG06966.1 sucrose operon repressor ScrR [Photobacterium angustum]PSV95061.1 LacI family transcriptional regulator [Photobacterium angustum]PSW80133.1 LacI family transcriptional regulator [Photobacterium angustum]
MTSLHDVALLAGVSKSTVSRVINNEYGVKESTKKKVQQAIAECGYLPNQVAKDLKSQKTNLIGVIVPRVSSHATAQGVDGLTTVFEKAGKQVLLANTHQVHQKELDYIHLFNQKRVEGIILYATNIDKAIVESIQKSSVPVVLVGQDGSMFNILSVVHDDERVGIEAANRLIARGCQNIGFLGVQGDDIAVDQLRSSGFIKSLKRQKQSLLFHGRGDFTIDSGYQLTQKYLNEYPHLDGLFCATDRIAIGAIQAIQDKGLKPGKDIAILGVGDDELASVCSPSLSTFHYSFDKAGERAANLLLDCILNNAIDMSKIVLTFQSIKRQSC